MAQKIIYIEGVGELPFYKRRGAQSVKIRINGNDVRVTLPNWMPYHAASMYVQQKAKWIVQNRQQKAFFTQSTAVGKQHTFQFRHSNTSRISARITPTEIIVTIPFHTIIETTETQKKLEAYAQKALAIEAEELIIPQVRDLAAKFNLHVNSIEIKNLKSRWGSCSSKQDLAFSLFLVQLPWECIDYVIIHELAHTKYMNHSKDFWSFVGNMEPSYKQIRKDLKSYSPNVIVH